MTQKSDIFHKLWRLLEADYIITYTNGRDVIEIGYSNTLRTRIKIEVMKA